MTNFERIKNMTVEEMAELLIDFENGSIDYRIGYCDICDHKKCTEMCMPQWLESEVEE